MEPNPEEAGRVGGFRVRLTNVKMKDPKMAHLTLIPSYVPEGNEVLHEILMQLLERVRDETCAGFTIGILYDNGDGTIGATHVSQSLPHQSHYLAMLGLTARMGRDIQETMDLSMDSEEIIPAC